jgi:hypothetical protein
MGSIRDMMITPLNALWNQQRPRFCFVPASLWALRQGEPGEGHFP